LYLAKLKSTTVFINQIAYSLNMARVMGKFSQSR